MRDCHFSFHVASLNLRLAWRRESPFFFFVAIFGLVGFWQGSVHFFGFWMLWAATSDGDDSWQTEKIARRWGIYPCLSSVKSGSWFRGATKSTTTNTTNPQPTTCHNHNHHHYLYHGSGGGDWQLLASSKLHGIVKVVFDFVAAQ